MHLWQADACMRACMLAWLSALVNVSDHAAVACMRAYDHAAVSEKVAGGEAEFSSSEATPGGLVGA